VLKDLIQLGDSYSAKKETACYGTQSSIAMPTKTIHWTWFWASSIHLPSS